MPYEKECNLQRLNSKNFGKKSEERCDTGVVKKAGSVSVNVVSYTRDVGALQKWGAHDLRGTSAGFLQVRFTHFVWG